MATETQPNEQDCLRELRESPLELIEVGKVMAVFQYSVRRVTELRDEWKRSRKREGDAHDLDQRLTAVIRRFNAGIRDLKRSNNSEVKRLGDDSHITGQ